MSERETLAMVPATITEAHDDLGSSMTVAVDLSSLGVPGKWEYDCVLAVDGGEITLLFSPPENQESPQHRSRDW
jgi:hypothetical protein